MVKKLLEKNIRLMMTLIITALATVTLPLAAMAGSATDPGAAAANGGAAIDSAKQQPLETKPQTDAGTVTVTEPSNSAAADNGQTVRVNGFRFSGATMAPEAQLQKLVQPGVGKDLTLTELKQLAEQVTRYLRSQGYIVAYAYLPPQRISDGIVELSVIPGKYGAILIENHSQVKEGRFNKILRLLKPGAVITQNTLERALLLLNDLAGVTAHATMKPGQASGTADLVVIVNPNAKWLNGAVSADNYGGSYTGNERGGVQLSLANLSQLGETINLGGLTAGAGLSSYNLSYNLPLAANGLTGSINLSRVEYTLGDDFASLDASGTADVIGLALKYPLIRSRKFNLYATAGYDHKNLDDEIVLTGTDNSRKDNLLNFGLSGNRADAWKGGGYTGFAVAAAIGDLSIKDTDALETDSEGAKSDGGFGKLTVTVNRAQHLTANLSLNLSFDGQLASKNLDSSEDFFLGGANGVKAYPQGEAAGDEGFRIGAELQWRVSKWSTTKHSVTLANFYDFGHVKINRKPYDDDDNSRSLSDTGLGVIWTWKNLNLRLDYAHKLGSEAATAATDREGRFWVRGGWSF